MPRILICGLPTAIPDGELLRHLLIRDLPAAVENTAGFDIARAHVFAHAVPEVIERPTVAVTFTIEGLIAKPERTAAMRQALSRAVADVIAGYLDRVNLQYESIIGWCVQIDREDDGFVRRPPAQAASHYPSRHIADRSSRRSAAERLDIRQS